ncbi:MAG: hypothetical protein ABJA98_01815 [Acidobacteriota bacterium]
MIPKFLSPEVLPFAAILLVGLPTPAPLQLICAWCDVVLRAGALPASHGICSECFDRVVA